MEYNQSTGIKYTADRLYERRNIEKKQIQKSENTPVREIKCTKGNVRPLQPCLPVACRGIRKGAGHGGLAPPTQWLHDSPQLTIL